MFIPTRPRIPIPRFDTSHLPMPKKLEPSALSLSLPKWLRDPRDLEGQAQRAAERAAEQAAERAAILASAVKAGIDVGFDRPLSAPLSSEELEAMYGPIVPGHVVILDERSPLPSIRQQRRLILRRLEKRERMFGNGRPKPLTSDEKKRIMANIRAQMAPTAPGMHYGKLTAKTVRVAEVLLYNFHNAKTGVCFPGYERIAAKAGCSRSTVHRAIHALEDAGILTWVHRIARRRDDGGFVRIVRSSNSYVFAVPLKIPDQLNQETDAFAIPLKSAAPCTKTSECHLEPVTKFKNINLLPSLRHTTYQSSESIERGNREADGAVTIPF